MASGERVQKQSQKLYIEREQLGSHQTPLTAADDRSEVALGSADAWPAGQDRKYRSG